MDMNASTLYAEVSKVCPVLGVSIGKPDDRSTWTFTPTAGATQPEIDAANNVIATIPLAIEPSLLAADFIARFTDAEYLALKQMHQADITANDATSTKVWDVVIAKDLLNMNSDSAQTLKSELVSKNVLTQARADEIFTSPPSARLMF